MNPARFDPIARGFDRRAGLPVECCEKAARLLVALAAPTPDELTLDIGAGTGEVGLALCRALPGYVGLDASAGMLDVFRERLDAEGRAARLVVADASGPWPVPEGTTRLVFGSRSLHLLDDAHVVGEARRLACARGVLVALGAVERAEGSVRDTMRRLLRRELRERGIAGRSGHKRRLRERLANMATLETHVVHEWDVVEHAATALANWRSLVGLDNVDVAPDVKAEILARVEAEGRAVLGDLEAPHASRERYVIAAAMLAGAPSH